MSRFAPVFKNEEMEFLLRNTGGPFDLFTKDYELLRNGAICCVLGFRSWKQVDFAVDGKRFVIRSDGKNKWVLVQGGVAMASCRRLASGPKLEFTVEFEGREWRFSPHRRKLVRTHEIREREREIGRITPKIGWLRPWIVATFNQDPRLEIAILAVWFVGIHWVGIAGTFAAARTELGI